MVTDVFAKARDLYLSEHHVTDDVAPGVLASWQRSLEFEVDARELRAPYREGVNLDVPLLRAARPVLDHLHEVLADEAISTMVTDKDGVILTREVSHAGFTTRLNRVSLAPGHVFSEQFVGTNGIGTALASGRAVTISGSEHFVDDLRPFFCAAVPIIHPLRRMQLGAFNLTTTAAERTSRVALALASSMAREIENELARISSQREYSLFERYMTACRGAKPVPVLALNEEVTMMNDKLRTAIVGTDQDALLDHAREVLSAGRSISSRSITLPSGRLIELQAADSAEPSDAGLVFHVRMVRRSASTRTTSESHPVLLPGLIGSTPSWTQAVQQLHTAFLRRVPTAVMGESGVGKVHAISAILRSGGVRGRVVVVEPPASVEAQTAWFDAFSEVLDETDGVIILRNAHWMEPSLADATAGALSDSDATVRARVFLTAPSADRVDARLLAQFDDVVELPPLRHRRDDVLRLARYFARRLRPKGDLEFSTATEQILQSCPWPGNVRQVENVVRALARQAHVRTVRPEHLPPECRVSSRQSLTLIEALERDTIVQVLASHGGNVHRAALELGLSRATVYRKLRRYGIEPTSV